MKKRLLIVINSLETGGAERSCVNFLTTLPERKYEVDLLLGSCTGAFIKYVPAWVRLAQIPYPYTCLSHKPKEWRFYIRHNPLVWMKKIMRTWKAKHQSKFHVVQAVYRQWEADFPTLENEYDVAIGYLEGVYNYFILDKVRAGRKIIWVHNNYDNLGYNPVFDFDYFVEADVIATMSPIAKESLQRNFPELADRIRFIENITDAGIVRKMAEEPIGEDGFAGFNGLKIISCGRLATQKAFERAIMAAVLIKKAGIPFRWIVIGDGPKKKELVRLKKDMKVDEDFRLAGLKENPYPYMRQADMLVVTSLYEGRSVVSRL